MRKTTPAPHRPSTPIAKRRFWLYALPAIVLIPLASFAAAAPAAPNTSSIVTLATTKQPEAFTELYFVTPTELPKTIKSGETYNFAFIITNHQSRTTTYQARVRLIVQGVSSVIQDRTVVLADAQSIHTTVPFTVDADNADAEIVVALVNQGPSIHFRSHS